MNVDGSFIAQHTFGGTCGVIRNSQGEFIAAFSMHVQHIASPKHVELVAMKEGLKLLRTLGYSNVVIETDSLEAVAAVNAINHEGMMEAGLIDDIKVLIKVF